MCSKQTKTLQMEHDITLQLEHNITLQMEHDITLQLEILKSTWVGKDISDV
jgi:hypothetical protein